MNKLAICCLILGLSSAASYSYTNYGDDWTEGVCATGVQQSPIDFDTDDARQIDSDLGMDLALNYNDFSGTSLSLTFPDSHSALVSRVSGGDMGSMQAKIVGGLGPYTFELLQFHFHAKSEHKIDGDRYPLEMHMVHQTSSTLTRPYAVIGILFEEGDENKFLAKLIDESSVDLDLLFGDDEVKDILYYEGGLTTPSCSEVVHWNIWAQVQEASKAQIEYLAGEKDSSGNAVSGWHETYRNVQPLNGRTLYYWNSLGDFDFAGVIAVAVAALFFF